MAKASKAKTTTDAPAPVTVQTTTPAVESAAAPKAKKVKAVKETAPVAVEAPKVAAPVVAPCPRAAATIQASQSDVLNRMIDLALSSGCMSFSASVGSGQATFIRR